MAITEERVQRIHDEASLFDFLGQELGWPVASTPDTYPFDADELGLTEEETKQIKQIRQIAPFEQNQPWGIFLVEFHGKKVYQGALRRVLRGLSETRRDRDASLPAWKAANLLFICTPNFKEFSFARFEGQTHTKATLSVFGWDEHESGLRTLCEYNLPALRYPHAGTTGADWLAHWATAWNVERVTERFYEEYKKVFDQVEGMITGVAGDKRLFTQRLFNRLMFIQFLSKKRWLRFGADQGGTDYLAALWEGRDRSVSFYSAHLCPLFFAALNNPHIHRDLGTESVLRSRIGSVPYLNGGLFQKSEDEGCGEAIPDAAFDLIINKLFSKFNFTVYESTPLDIEVAVDPEMLGKVFEELVTGRHESGSYYTQRPVVSFMCKEALKGYLGGYANLVDHHDASDINVPQAKDLLRRLAEVKVVDLACGSGAYLLGMLQELFALNRILDTRAEQATARDNYRRKLDIIRNNIYGVDLDDFAVQIARLRLWLSLAVEFEGDVPEPLPNLDFKVEQGDSLSSPDPQGGPTADIFRSKDIEEISLKKGQYADPYYPYHPDQVQKPVLKTQIKKLEDSIAAWAHPGETVHGFDWRVKFIEVFEPQEPLTDVGGAMNFGGTLAEARRPGGFDIALQNPPYIRQELIGANKPHLQRLYAEAVDGKSDLYCYFYMRALQLLRPGGIQIFICSNSWLDVGYGGKLQKYLLENGHVQAIYDSSVERQFATAEVNTVISIIKKEAPRDDAVTRFVMLNAPFEQAMAEPALRREFARTRSQLWEAGLGEPNSRGVRPYKGDKWGGKYLRAPDIYWKIQEKTRGKLIRLGDITDVRRGFTTGVNEFFYMDADKAAEWSIEKQFLRPVIKTPRNYYGIRIQGSDTLLFKCKEDEDELEGTSALEYIRWGETQGFHRNPSCISRRNWYALNGPEEPRLLWPSAFFERHIVYECPSGYVADKVFYTVSGDIPVAVKIFLNSSLVSLLVEAEGYQLNHGGIFVTTDWLSDVMVPTEMDGSLEALYNNIASRDVLLCADELKLPDRKALDAGILEWLGLQASDADELHTVIEAFVKGRIMKARRGVTQAGRHLE